MLTQDDKMGRGWQMRRPTFQQPQQMEGLGLRNQQTSQKSTVVGDKLKPKSDKIYVHYFPHSHTDLGWVNTLDEYYYGVQIGHYNNKVKSIIGTSIDELEKYDYRTFTFAEIKFFQMWWEEQREEKRESVKKLVQNGQLELINGGWSAPDEACPNYDDLLDNWHMGQKFLIELFGYQAVAPGLKLGWQIDTFGLSSAYARLASDVGIEALFVQRADH